MLSQCYRHYKLSKQGADLLVCICWEYYNLQAPQYSLLAVTTLPAHASLTTQRLCLFFFWNCINPEPPWLPTTYSIYICWGCSDSQSPLQASNCNVWTCSTLRGCTTTNRLCLFTGRSRQCETPTLLIWCSESADGWCPFQEWKSCPEREAELHLYEEIKTCVLICFQYVKIDVSSKRCSPPPAPAPSPVSLHCCSGCGESVMYSWAPYEYENYEGENIWQTRLPTAWNDFRAERCCSVSETFSVISGCAVSVLIRPKTRASWK